MIDFADFYQRLDADEVLAPYRPALQNALDGKLERVNHGDLPGWLKALDNLPALTADRLALDRGTVTIDSTESLSAEQAQQLEASYRALMPWRKGPFRVFGLEIDTEWRSDFKWDRLAPHISDLRHRRVLDIGCGSGYHCWRMHAAGAREVIGIDPSLKFLIQFRSLKRYIGDTPVELLPLGIEELPRPMRVFDTVFSMGVFYHRKSPIDHLLELQDLLRPGGELVLETLVVDGDQHTVLLPGERYAQMRNVWFLPSVAALCQWLERVGYVNVRCVDVNQTSPDEQRSTDWMRFHSLSDFLDPADPQLTVEGYPAPKRAIVLAERPY
ncbi:tRNA 5-methoxyuridine(34)/uridine 5-oxyacetic acid(34) synthase CmoB [Motiliproteus sediminis]|uniref:tRNA 5-methoxyuridine(34)/uridine 5-oxyacetic acid(34) synthase CmoB n=1 Tax=Motiliproteus sediminis TaxID=1468178 RepID=UPI001AEFBC50|nr:tRNA 5-methoxyuridine(34)/uridine 5-oxyacetic acid(34) synthase CmoB [Motiliproteus sediminis]